MTNIRLIILFFYLSFGANAQLKRYEYVQNHMGSPFKVVFYADSDSLANEASHAVFSRIGKLNTILSDYLDGSEINQLSATSGSKKYIPVSYELFDVIQKSIGYSRRTNGLFDITLGPVTQVWRMAMRVRRFPEKERIRYALKRTGYKLIRLSVPDTAVLLKKEKMKLDVGGIGKGYAADAGIAVLNAMGIRSALIDAGGDLTLSDAPPGSKGWKIDISSGDNTDSIRVLELANVGIATSGDTYRYLEHNGIRYSHIVNPKTGIGLTHHVRTTVIAATGTEADALTKVFSISGIEKSKKIIKQFPDLSVWLIENNQGITRHWSHGFENPGTK